MGLGLGLGLEGLHRLLLWCTPGHLPLPLPLALALLLSLPRVASRIVHTPHELKHTKHGFTVE